MSFNRRGPDRRHDRPDRSDRPDRDRGDRPGYGPRGDRPPHQRDRPPYEQRGDRPPYEPRGGERPYAPRPRFDRPPDEGAMSLRLDPRRASALKRLAGEAGVRPGDLARQWVEERIDAARAGGDTSLPEQLARLAERVAALEAGRSSASAAAAPPESARSEPPAMAEAAEPSESAPAEPELATVTGVDAGDEVPAGTTGERGNAVSARPAARVALHDEMIAVLRERGPMSASELAAAVSERGRYTPPRSGKQLDAAMVSQRVSNPTYRSRFTREGGRIGLAEGT